MPDSETPPPWSPNTLEAYACQELLKRVQEVSKQITDRVRQATQETNLDIPPLRDGTSEGPALS